MLLLSFTFFLKLPNLPPFLAKPSAALELRLLLSGQLTSMSDWWFLERLRRVCFLVSCGMALPDSI
jgi:hypothetical protein